MNAQITPSTTVNDAIRLAPATVEVFKRYRIDACCGGALSMNGAAARHGTDVTELLEALNRLPGGER